MSVVVVYGQIKEMFAVGKKERPAMRGVLGDVELGDGSRSSSIDADTVDTGLCVGNQKNNSAGPPGSATAEAGVADDGHRAAIQVNNLQLAVGEESQRMAVGGPERKDCAISAGKLMRFQQIHGADPERNLAVRSDGRKSQRSTVRRQHGWSAKIAGQAERDIWRRIDERADRLGHRM